MPDNSGQNYMKIIQAQEVLHALGLPKAQCNERSALTLLALLDLKEETEWKHAKNPLMGITPVMDFFTAHYEKKYAPNSRETVRRQTVHQFLQAGLIVQNPDDPQRPVNSGKTVYQIMPNALKVLRKFGANSWTKLLQKYLKKQPTLRQGYTRKRKLHSLPVVYPDGSKGDLSPGGQNPLIKCIIEKFCPRFTPGGHVLYVGDAEDKFRRFFPEEFKKLGITIEKHGKMPDVVIAFYKENWLILIEAVISHGPMNSKRHDELMELFSKSKFGLVYVTAFESRKTMKKFLTEIDWETEVWVAESPDHLIHFNGIRFLGPY